MHRVIEFVFFKQKTQQKIKSASLMSNTNVDLLSLIRGRAKFWFLCGRFDPDSAFTNKVTA